MAGLVPAIHVLLTDKTVGEFGKQMGTFSLRRWVALAITDIVIRFGCIMLMFFPLSLAFSGYLLPQSLRLSLTHLGLLIPIAYIVWIFERRPRRALTISLIIVNALFVSIFVLLRLSEASAGRITSCHGAADNCSWKDGHITSLGVSYLTSEISGYVVLNVLLVLSFWLASRWREHQGVH